MRISDWSSDVCSSDLNVGFVRDAEVYAGDANKKGAQAGRPSVGRWQGRNHLRGTQSRTSSNSKRATPHSLLFELVFFSWMNFTLRRASRSAGSFLFKIGRASCRESVCQYV